MAKSEVGPPPGGAISAASAAQSVREAKNAAKHPAALAQVILPDIFAVNKQGITAAQLARLAKLKGVRNVIAVDGGAVKIGADQVNVIGVNPAQFRPWTSPQTAAQQSLWTALSKGQLVTTGAVRSQLSLRTGSSYQIAAGSQPRLTFAGTANLVVPSAQAIVDTQVSKELGLVNQLGVLVSAPGVSVAKLEKMLRGVLGNNAQFASLLPVTMPSSTATRAASQQEQQLPVDNGVPTTARPTTWLSLFQESAKLYCPGLSWTVLAAIGQIESADGQNEGPSSAGALGPMQFEPSTWSMWGIDGFGETGTPDIMNPYDAVPSAAEYLCAAGASQPADLSNAIFAYNHATWYVSEVLALARQYAEEYS
ncbi:MAG TPA: lytic transglycosylase domain-containing protein [Streptosporangiaceae bacterium]|jgi:hypothetical protein